jgi:hypothetical protein
MGTLLEALGALFALTAFACQIVVVVTAFKRSPITGLLSVLCFPFTLYYAFTGFERPWKGTILAGWLGGILLAIVLTTVGKNMVAATPPQ